MRQAYFFAMELYLISLCYTAILASSIFNVKNFLIARKKYKVLPLTLYYILAISLCLFRLV